MGKDILHRVGNGGQCGCETVSREVLPQVEILEKWTQEPPCFAITIWCAIKIAHQQLSCPIPSLGPLWAENQVKWRSGNGDIYSIDLLSRLRDAVASECWAVGSTFSYLIFVISWTGTTKRVKLCLYVGKYVFLIGSVFWNMWFE